MCHTRGDAFGIGQGVVLVAFEGEAHGLGHIAGMLALEIDAVRGEPGQRVFVRRRGQAAPTVQFEIGSEDQVVAAERPGFRGPREIEKRTKRRDEIDAARRRLNIGDPKLYRQAQAELEAAGLVGL